MHIAHVGRVAAVQEELLMALERHLEQHDYVLGGRPSLADFSLLGQFMFTSAATQSQGLIFEHVFPWSPNGSSGPTQRIPSMLGNMVKSYTRSMTPVYWSPLTQRVTAVHGSQMTRCLRR